MTHPEVRSLTVNEALDALENQYNAAVEALRAAITAFIDNGSLPDPAQRASGLFVYPQLCVSWKAVRPCSVLPAPLAASLAPAVTAARSPARRCCATT